MVNLLTELKSELASIDMSRLSSALGESESNVQKGIDGVLPAFLAKVLSTATNNSGAGKLLDTMNSLIGSPGTPTDTEDAISRVSSPEGQDAAQSLQTSLLGGDTSRLLNSLSSSFGIPKSLVSGIIGIVAPLLFRRLNSLISGSGDPRSALMSLATTQLGLLQNTVPSNLASSLGITEPAGPAYSEPREYPDASRGESPSRSWGVPALLALLVGVGGVWWLTRNVERERIAPESELARDADREFDIRARGALGLKPLRLPNGREIAVPEGGFVDTVVLVLSGTAPGDRSIAFDRVNFERQSAALTPDSRQQLDQFSEVLKAYPTVRIRVSGFTDNQGNENTNRTLSLARSNAVKQELASRGVDVKRIDTAGHGPESPIATNDTEEGRAANRRIEVVILR